MAIVDGEMTDLPLLRDPMHLACDYIYPYKDAGDVAPAAVYGSTSPTTRMTRQ